jgi:ubiquinol-cytochrome c reductase subunit 7
MPVAPSLYNAAVKRPWLMSMLKPLAGWYANAAGYRQMGLL